MGGGGVSPQAKWKYGTLGKQNKTFLAFSEKRTGKWGINPSNNYFPSFIDFANVSTTVFPNLTLPWYPSCFVQARLNLDRCPFLALPDPCERHRCPACDPLLNQAWPVVLPTSC